MWKRRQGNSKSQRRQMTPRNQCLLDELTERCFSWLLSALHTKEWVHRWPIQIDWLVTLLQGCLVPTFHEAQPEFIGILEVGSLGPNMFAANSLLAELSLHSLICFIKKKVQTRILLSSGWLYPITNMTYKRTSFYLTHGFRCLDKSVWLLWAYVKAECLGDGSWWNKTNHFIAKKWRRCPLLWQQRSCHRRVSFKGALSFVPSSERFHCLPIEQSRA